MQTNGILGLIILLADIFALFKIAKSAESTGMKLLWIVIVLVLPVLGLIAWFFAGPGDKALKI
ncbi:MAG: PLD nuclease N-terminal domain-containing protein [gamma proteobacterium symbiont of Bathyaustriella thionipta]|nr:PLD nuclease N-terminal domain-containing protein [gamma proteobacterium symbiont of Bathyaustriella thionipta]MCU7949441.1 PLD nuclease N-terminal domain-containing protein [gamma proteobacterium symbiont of Bathyaustriella thionipta]MCU7954043.1 PLD nuclease N-terminal domain-containing protein [gamma proteobacterium symbiont of Bathyaustriella thionipta]MCU7956028.1 PLD nuclease N-terminal domain-containing protein [gamma proteobacterium symbiont of Bathyaustriella thionipta]MCU7966224.1 